MGERETEESEDMGVPREKRRGKGEGNEMLLRNSCRFPTTQLGFRPTIRTVQLGHRFPQQRLPEGKESKLKTGGQINVG